MVGLRARLIAMLVIVMVLAFVLLLVGVNFGLRNDVKALASQSVEAGSNALSSAVASRVEQTRTLMLQAAAQPSLARALAERDVNALQSIVNDTAISGGLSFVVVTDAKGKVLAGNRPAAGSLAGDGVVKSALGNFLIGGPKLLDGPELIALGVSANAPALAIVTASPVNLNGVVLGTLYGGTVLDSTTKFVDDVSHLTGGQAGIAVNGSLVATSIATKEGVKEVGLTVPNANAVANRNDFTGEQKIDGVDYYVMIAPLASYDGSVIGAYWFGIPFAQFDAVVNHTLGQIVLWGAIGLVFALIAGMYSASRIGRAIIRRSEEVNESAQELKVLVVGGEVSGDHVVKTRATLEEIRSIVVAEAGDGARITQLRDLAHRAVDDVVVIDTLTAELAARMRDAAARVERLSEVARALDELVAGARPSRN
ncbi:MAG TPA: cache domain-containing protein [Candidatus Baltobacteraceae bacterium]|nr:cache domain-containing protein [Candidatus Baltobacteraceae bacterium]